MENLVAKLLQSSSSALAGHAANELFEVRPDSAGRFGPDSFRRWRDYLGVRFQELAVAVEFAEPSLFGDAMAWARHSFELRRVPAEDLHAALRCMSSVIARELPSTASPEVNSCLERGQLALAGTASAPTALDPSRPMERRALTYLDACLSGHPRRALETALADVETASAARDIYLELIPAAQREVGRLWHAAKVGVHEEHLVTTTTRTLMALLVDRFGQEPTAGCVIGAALGEDAHDVGVQLACDLFALEGWRAICLGSRMPAEDLARAASDFDTDLLILSATLLPHLVDLRRAVQWVRKESHPVKILVGGGALSSHPELWRKIGADGHAASAREVVRVATELLR